MGQRLTKRDIRLLQEDRRINAINFINNIVKEKDELQSMIDQAIEFLKLFDENSTLIDHSVIKGALTILKGSDPNE